MLSDVRAGHVVRVWLLVVDNWQIVELDSDVETHGLVDNLQMFSIRSSSSIFVGSKETSGPDGVLLYVAEASYEPGTSPLSSWIPIAGHDTHRYPNYSLNLFERSSSSRLIYRRITRMHRDIRKEVEMDIEASDEDSIARNRTDAGSQSIEGRADGN